MSEELIRVLKMIESGVITSEEGQKLIQAMQKSEQKVARVNSHPIGRFLRLDILSTEEGEKETVQINFPLNLAKAVLKMGIVQKQLNAKGGENVNLDIEEILALIDSEVMGDLMTIDTKDAKIRIWID
ncbi:SHOCT-like domain-containing protein [Turicibacter bilis]|uniref:SHOCT-like domain-containing protein n=1 Tax=Turicibacter bilis TaxID=2735723 RepID=UPI003F89740B